MRRSARIRRTGCLLLLDGTPPADQESPVPERAHPVAPSKRAVVQLDAYPRLCGLPVTIERVVTTGIGAPDVPAAAASRPRSARRAVYLIAAILAVAATLIAGATAARAQPPASAQRAPASC
jgi:hypothetical protein